MTKPTGNPRGRPKTKEYVTLMARVPLELVDQARRYAARKRQPISEVLRDGLVLLLEQEDTAPHYVYDRNPLPVKMSDTKEDTASSTEAPQARQSVIVSDTKEAMLALDTQQPVIVYDTKEDSLSVGTLPVKMSDTKEAVVVPSFDTTRHHLGPLCKRGHEWGGYWAVAEKCRQPVSGVSGTGEAGERCQEEGGAGSATR